MKRVFIYGEKNILKNYEIALKKLNAKAVISKDICIALDCDYLLLAGGGDISPCLYNSTNNNCHDVDLERDIAEQYLIAKFLSKKRPILGICRGLQTLNVFFDGTLSKKIKNSSLHYNKNKDVMHETLNSGFMKNIYGKYASVNSRHRQCVERTGNGLFVSALSKDGIIEALENKYLKIYAVQFHPERMGDDGLPIIEKFLYT